MLQYIALCCFVTALVPLSRSHETISIIPDGYECTNDTVCYSLHYLTTLHDASYVIASNTTVLLLPTTYHFVNGEYDSGIILSNVSNISFTVDCQYHDNNCIALIECFDWFGIGFFNVANLLISGLQFHNCGSYSSWYLRASTESLMVRVLHRSIDSSMMFEIPSVLYFSHTSNLNVSNVSITESHYTSAGIIGVNTLEQSVLSHMRLSSSYPNIALYFTDVVMEKFHDVSSLKIINCISNYSQRLPEHSNSPQFGGLRLHFLQHEYRVSISLYKIIVRDNERANILLRFETHIITTVVGRYIDSSNGSVYVKLMPGTFGPRKYPLEHSVTVSFERSTFSSTEQKDAAIDVYGPTMNFSLSHCSVSNSSPFGLCSQYTRNVSLISSTFLANAVAIKAQDSVLYFSESMIANSSALSSMSAVNLLNSNATFTGSVTFDRNAGGESGAIYCKSSWLFFKGDLKFSHNSGLNGGALSLLVGSVIVFYPTSRTEFTSNNAVQTGGAIYSAQPRYVQKGILCFFQPQPLLCLLQASNGSCIREELIPLNASVGYSAMYPQPIVSGRNNTATIAGNFLYGGSIDNCVILQLFNRLDGVYSTSVLFDTIWRHQTQSGTMFNTLFELKEAPSDLSRISSDPLQICVCDNTTTNGFQPQCNQKVINTESFPGKTFTLSVVAVGQRLGVVPGTVYAELLPSDGNSSALLGNLQNRQRTEKECTTVRFSIASQEDREVIILSVEELTGEYKSLISKYVVGTPNGDIDVINDTVDVAIIATHLLPCPAGFQLSGRVCACDSVLRQHGINCNLDAYTIYRPAPFWISFEPTTELIIVYKHCPFDYCKPYDVNISIESPDQQCDFMHSGTLCGGCKTGFSQTLGSSHCQECSSLWVMLVFPSFIVAGIAVVVFLTFLNLTISVGSINALIFYANIVKVSEATFFPSSGASTTVSSVFISWLNLDAGIKTCFYNGLDGYSETWFQFLFPLYIWLIVVVIIVLSHYSSFFAKLSGTNAVPVLATLFLLSYAKLLRTVITVLSSTRLVYGNNVKRVWLYDANVEYLHGKHIPLFVAALLVLLLLSIPYTLLLLSIQWLHKIPPSRLSLWIHKLKPLLDAYTGPYRDSHRYWTGLLLLVRAGLYLVFSLNVIGDPALNILAISITSFGLLALSSVVNGVYRKPYLNVLEHMFYLNIGILSALTFYIRLSGGNQRAVAHSSVAVALCTFLLIVIHHIYLKATPTMRQRLSEWLKHCKTSITKISHATGGARARGDGQQQNANANASPPQQLPGAQPRVAAEVFIELREPLLEYCSS